RGVLTLVRESDPLKTRTETQLWSCVGSISERSEQFDEPTISQVVRRWKSADPKGECATQTGWELPGAAVTWAMSSAEQSWSGLRSQLALQAAENESSSGASFTEHLHSFASLHVCAMPVTLPCTFCPQTFTASFGFPHARNSVVYFLGVYLTTRAG